MDTMIEAYSPGASPLTAEAGSMLQWEVQTLRSQIKEHAKACGAAAKVGMVIYADSNEPPAWTFAGFVDGFRQWGLDGISAESIEGNIAAEVYRLEGGRAVAYVIDEDDIRTFENVYLCGGTT